MNDSLKKKEDTKSKGKKLKLKDRPTAVKGMTNNRNGHAKPDMKKSKKALKNKKTILSGVLTEKKNVKKGGKLGKKQKLKNVKESLENNPNVIMVDSKSKTIPGKMFVEPKDDVNNSTGTKIETKSQVRDSKVGNLGAVKFQKLKKVVNNPASKEVRESVVKDAELEERAESVDSGCIPDSSSDTVADATDWLQVKSALMEENKFVSTLLKWLPAPPAVKEYEVETKKGQKRKQEDRRAGNNKKQRVGVGFVDGNADLNELQDRYRNTLMELKKNRKKNQYDPAAKKKQEKLTKKLKRLEKRKDKRTKRKLKVAPERTEIKTEKKPVKNVKPQKPIYNQNGEMVFSKFDFSSTQHSGSMDFNTKPKDLKQMLSQALKEKERMKNLEKKGNKEGAATLIDQKAWSNAMKKTEGVKVKTDVDLLKKSIKKQEQRKKTSQKKWEQRQETIDKKITDKQNTRKKNIAARKDAKLNKKMKKMKKKGHIVPGF